MKKIIVIIFVLIGFVAKAQLPANTFISRNFTGNTKSQWIILDSPLVNPILDTFYARYLGTQIIRIQGGDTSLWFYGGNRRWFRSLQAPDTLSLSNRISLKLNITDTTNKWWSVNKRFVDTVYRVNDSTIGFTINNGSQQTFQILGRSSGGGGGGSGTVTSVALSMPSAFSVSGSPITTNGTFAVSGAGTTSQYIRGNGTLATTDTSMIPSFSVKVRGLFSGAAPITLDQSTGVIGAINANASGTKGVATFNNSDFTDNGSGLISLRNPSGNPGVDTIYRTAGIDSIYFTINGTTYAIKDSTGGGSSGITQLTGDVTAGPGSGSQVATIANNAVTTSKINNNAVTLGKMATGTANRLLGYDGSGNASVISLTTTGSSGAATISGGVLNIPQYSGGSGSTNSNIGSGYRWAVPGTNNIITAFGNNTLTIDSSSNTNALTFKVDTSVIATKTDLLPKIYYYVDKYGAKGDSVTDNTSFVRAAIADMGPYGGILQFSQGNYVITDSIIIPANVTVAGVAGNANTNRIVMTLSADSFYLGSSTNILFRGGNKKCFVAGAGLPTLYKSGINFKNFNLRYQGSAPTAGAGIFIADGGNYHMDGITVSGFYDDVYQSVACYEVVTNSVFGEFAHCGFICNNTYIADWMDIAINNCLFYSGRYLSPLAAFYTQSPGGIKIQNCKTNLGVYDTAYLMRYAILIDDSLGVSQDILLNNLSLESFQNSAIKMHFGSQHQRLIALSNIQTYTVSDAIAPAIDIKYDLPTSSLGGQVLLENIMSYNAGEGGNVNPAVRLERVRYASIGKINERFYAKPYFSINCSDEKYTYTLDRDQSDTNSTNLWAGSVMNIMSDSSWFSGGPSSIRLLQGGHGSTAQALEIDYLHRLNASTGAIGDANAWLFIKKDTNGIVSATIENASTGVSAWTNLKLRAAGVTTNQFIVPGSGSGGYGIIASKNFGMYSNSNDIAIMSEGAAIKFGTTGTESGRFVSDKFLLGSTTDDATSLAQFTYSSGPQLSLKYNNIFYTTFKTSSGGILDIVPVAKTTRLAASSVFGASLNLISSAGTDPSSPNDGDMWNNGTLNYRHGSITVDLLNLTVPNGGTGRTSLTAYAVLTGGTTSTGALQQVSGVGTAGQVLTSNGAGVLPTWQTAAGGITTLNTLTAATQTFATGTSGSDFNISSATSTHTFNIPDASTSARGLVITTSQTFGGKKTFNDGAIVTTQTAVSGTSLVVSGDRTLGTAPGISGIGLQLASFTYTNTEASTTESGGQNFHLVNTPTLTSSNAVTYSGDVSTIRFVGAPIAGGSSTISHPWNIFANDVNYFQTLAMGLNEQSGDVTLGNGSIAIYTGSGGNTFTLPSLSGNPGKTYFIKNAGSGNLTLSRGGSDNLWDTSSVTTITIAAGGAVIVSAGTSFWYVQKTE